MSLPTPNTRKEQYLNAIATGNAGGLPTPITREEEYLDAIAKSGGGSGDGDMKKSVYDSDLAVSEAGGIKAFVGDAVSDSEKDIYAVMGEMGAKNLIPYPYYDTTKEVSDVVVTDNGDGTLAINGTASANATVFRYLDNDAGIEIPLERRKYKLTFGTDQGSSGFHLGDFRLVKTNSTTQVVNVTGDTIIDNTNGDYLGINAMSIYVAKNKVIDNVTIYPMLRLASDTDDTYQPYSKTNKQLTDDKVDKVEGKGLSTNDYSDTEKGKVADNASAIEAINENGCCNVAVHNCKSTTIEGATFTVNADSSITATAPITGAWQGVASTALFKLKGGITYKLTSGLPATSGFFMQLRDENSVDLANTYQVTEATYTPLTDMNCKVAFFIHDGYSMTSDETLYPMIYDARLKPTGYVPYAMTNRELTDMMTRRYYNATRDTTKTTNGLINCVVRSGWAYVMFQALAMANAGNSQEGLVSGLPVCRANSLTFSLLGDSVSNTAAINNGGDMFWINEGETTLNGHLSNETYNKNHWGTVVYPTD